MKNINYELPFYKVETRGFASLSDAETITLIIGEKTAEKVKKLLSDVNHNLRELAKLSLSDMERAGLTKTEAKKIAAILEIGRRKQLSEALEVEKIKRSKDVADILQPLLCDLDHEEFYVVFLNRSNKVLKFEKISQGGLSGTVTDIRVIMKKAINLLASGIICCHNHPSGNLQPSEADTRITQKIKQAGELLDIQLLDHIIISDKDYYSFADNGII